MKLYLFRHGIAEDRKLGKEDHQRILTPAGIGKTEKIALKLKKLELKFDLIITSPLIRAKQTAQILQKHHLAQQIKEDSTLAPQGDIQQWIKWLQKSDHSSKSQLLLVGHQPDLGHWAEVLVWGESQEKIILKKAGIIGLEILDQDQPIGNSEIFLLTSPKWLLTTIDS